MYQVINTIQVGIANAGRTLHAQLYDSDGSANGAVVTSTFLLRPGALGIFVHVASVPDGHVGWMDYFFSDATGVVIGTWAINPREFENADMLTSLVASSIVAPDNAGIAAIRTKTDNLPTDPADESLLEAAIAALNNLSSADAQAAAAAALITYGVATSSEVASVASVVAAQNPATYDAGAITMQRGVTFDATLTGLIIPSSWTGAVLTVKRRVGEADSSALLQIYVSNPAAGSDGLQRLAGYLSGITATDASLAINQADGEAAIHVEDAAAAELAVGAYWYDLKIYYGSSDSSATQPQRWNVTSVVTEAV